MTQDEPRMTETSELTLSDLKKLIAFIQQNYRFDFSNYAMSSFKRRLMRILQLYSLPSVDDLIRKLQVSHDFFEVVLREITVNHTEMFRAPSFWRKLRDQVLPVLAYNNPIRIWSAACSSGEEIYSLSILLHETGLYDKVKIVASDINDKVIEKAKKGSYWLRTLEISENNYTRFEGKKKLSDYFSVSGENYVMHRELLRNVSFRQYDLVCGQEFLKFDLILCRNVMIYFNPELQDRVIRLFNKSLFLKGLLAVGEKETIAFCRSADRFETFSPEERIYRKIQEV